MTRLTSLAPHPSMPCSVLPTVPSSSINLRLPLKFNQLQPVTVATVYDEILYKKYFPFSALAYTVGLATGRASSL